MSSPAKRVFFALFAFVAVSSLISVAQPGASPGSPLKIGYSLDSLKVERWQTDLDEFKKRAQELGAEVLSETADGDDGVQYRQCEKLIKSGVKVLVIVPHNSGSAAKIVKMAKEKHVPVLDYERLIRNADVDLFVGYDSKLIGVQQATALVERAPKGNYVLIGGSQTDNNAKMIHDGQMSVLEPLVTKGDIKIISDTWTPEWLPSAAYVSAATALQSSKGDVAAIVAGNDGMAGGAIQALNERKLAGKVLVSGQDADLESIIHIIEGTQTMTVYKPIVQEARQAAEAAVRLAKNEPIQTTAVMPNGSKDVPSILLSAVTVTKANVNQTVIKDGFQKTEEVRRGLPQEKWSEVE